MPSPPEPLDDELLEDELDELLLEDELEDELEELLLEEPNPELLLEELLEEPPSALPPQADKATTNRAALAMFR